MPFGSLLSLRAAFASLGLALTLSTSLLPVTAEASVALPIRNRAQWLENNGYCGETSLQECALFYGIYASQHYIRGIYDPTQKNDLVEAEEWLAVLPRLGLEAEFFPEAAVPEPQYQTYMVWVKRHLEARHPVIITCYLSGDPNTPRETNPVDHIMTATGYLGASPDRYSDDDVLLFNIHYPSPFSSFAAAQQGRFLFDDRPMTGNGRTYPVAIQKEHNYGIAITGTSNRSRHAVPVRLELDRIDEPNLPAGEFAVRLRATVQMSGLTPGRTYVLYRYNDPTRVPARNYAASPSDARTVFTASGPTHQLRELIASDSVAVFRCLPAGH